MNDDTIPKEYPILVSTMDYPISISWKVRDLHLQAVLKIGEKAFSLQSEDSVSLLQPNTKIMLRFGSESSEFLPKEFSLYQNYPNPFNPSTSINFDLPEDAFVTLKIYNIMGQVIAVLVDQKMYKAGRYSEIFNTSSLSSGVYFYRLDARGVVDDHEGMSRFQSVKKMCVVR
ncbi:MAG TPA: T9SS type A sorting domain-containing protein [Bacteroidota bacterium]|nr:T9SS type A sorting domain-containing protein [Bacteroidota bacterium]